MYMVRHQNIGVDINLVAATSIAEDIR